ncbi:MAG: hypothetical protein Q8P39_01860 [Candidatus Yanofskybacteria bacterium]|nr:hypothetical protein [Candidatus Yanofskybacteria bacterium]
MTRKFEKFIQGAKKIRMKRQEKKRIRKNLIFSIQKNSKKEKPAKKKR